ncbi:AH receptor-interacting protein isoform X2 [Prorops nasuta]|uniref:AH receptor-interacting protein isoform X2 n=1 Tax=Prorops nasuta TaxID=863751 RepID=UPI0034CF1585
MFHFKTTKCNQEKTVLDDSKKMQRPMELVLGKKFKLEVWEAIVQKMALNEVARFTINKSLVATYPFVSKTLREVGLPQLKKRNHHCCGVTLQNEGIGYDDLNDLIKNPQDLEFTIELINVIPPNEYEKELWQMTESEKLQNIPQLREKGNTLFKQKDYEAASRNYAMAIGLLDQLMLAEKPNEKEWAELNEKRIPLLLNYAQCKLINKEYYEVIEHCSNVLKNDPDNIKALYRRGKAYIGIWDEKKAINDLEKVKLLDFSLKKSIDKELRDFLEKIKEKEKTQQKKLAQMFK